MSIIGRVCHMMLSRRWHNLPPQALIDSSWKTWFHNVIWNCSWKKRIWSHTDGEKVCAVWKPLKLAPFHVQQSESWGCIWILALSSSALRIIRLQYLKFTVLHSFCKNQIGLEGLLHWPLVLQSHTLLSDAKLEAIHTMNSKVLS